MAWIGRRWLEFRLGYSTYLVFMFGFSNFMLILYNFLPSLKDILSIEYFIPIVLGIIIPTSVIIGHLHNKSQFPIETRVQTHLNPYVYKIIKSSKEEMGIKLALGQLRLFEHLAKNTKADHSLISEIAALRESYESLLQGNDSREILK